MNNEIQYGFCQCGCGEKTDIIKENDISKNWIKGEPKRFIYHHYSRNFANGEKHHLWKGGEIKRNIDGRRFVRIPDHARAHKNGYVRKAIVIAEKALGKPLPKGSEVHHANRDPSKDRGNLVICENHAYHLFLHMRLRAYLDCGNPNWRKCWVCKKYDEPENLYIAKNNKTVFHKSCVNSKVKERKAIKRTWLALEAKGYI